MAKNNKVYVGGDSDSEDKIVKKLPSKNLNRPIGYLTLNAKQAFT